MSKENLEQFMSKVADSEELQAKIGEQIDADVLVALGAECGCEFTAEELQEAAELSDDELDEVAGGWRVDGGGRGPKVKSPSTGAVYGLRSVVGENALGDWRSNWITHGPPPIEAPGRCTTTAKKKN